MKKQISKFNEGDTVTWMEDGWNQVVATIADKDEEFVTLVATSITFGCIETDWIVRPLDMMVSKWQSPVPEILQEEIL
jgi:hypothetical protein